MHAGSEHHPPKWTPSWFVHATDKYLRCTYAAPSPLAQVRCHAARKHSVVYIVQGQSVTCRWYKYGVFA
jgi:hypothetical protein